MLNFINRVILLEDTKAESVAKVKTLLEKTGIPYKVKTVSSGSAKPAVRIPRTGRTGNIGSGYSDVYLGGGVPHSWFENNSSNTVYIIYVLKKDLERAKEICRGDRG